MAMLVSRALELWIILCAVTTAAGWLFSALGILGKTAYLLVFVLFALIVYTAFRKRGLDGGRGFQDLRKILRRCRSKLPPFLFLCLAVLSFIGAFAYQPIHSDSLSYRIPRILHWLAEGRWHWIHTPDDRMNVVAASTEWVWAPVMVFANDQRLLCLIGLISFLFLPGLLYSLFIRLGIQKRLAWWWMWLLPAAYCYALQAGSLATDGFAATFSVAAVVYAFKAVERGSAYYALVSVLAIAFATGTKQTILLAVPLWFIPFVRCVPILLKKPVLATAAIIFGVIASFLPMAIANTHYVGTWKGFAVEADSPIWAFVGNALYLPFENLLPPIFPPAREWNAAMLEFVRTPIGSNFSRLEEFGQVYRGPSENFGGLGFTTCFLLIAGLFTGRSLRPALNGFSRFDLFTRRALLVLPWLMLPAFMVSVTFSRSARYLAFYFPFLFAGILYVTHRPYRRRWWRIAAYISMIATLATLALLRQRPIFPVGLTTTLVERFVSKDLAIKARNAFSFASDLRSSMEAFENAIPPNAKIVGYIARVGLLEPSLWHPYGFRRVWRFGGEDSPAVVRSKGVEYVILAQDALQASGFGNIEAWLEHFNGEVIFSRGMAPQPDAPLEETYLIKLQPN